MIKMVLKRIWKQGRGNGCLLIESFIVFVLFCIFANFLLVQVTPSFDCPKGYRIDQVYSLKLDRDHGIKTAESIHESIEKIIQSIEKYPAVESVTAYFGAKHFEGYARLYLKRDSIEGHATFFSTDEHYHDVFKVEMEEDGGVFPWKTENGKAKIIFTQSVSNHFFGDKNPLGKRIETGNHISYHISGLVKETEHSTQYVPEKPYCYTTLPENYQYDLQTSIAFKIKDEISYEQFENKEMDDFKKILSSGAVYPDLLRPFKQIKKETIYNNGQMTLAIIGIAVLLFFIFNLFISMFASFHFRINKRKEEIGLKLSIGASKRMVMKELILEGVLILTFAAIPAIIMVVNLFHLEALVANGQGIGWECIAITYTFLVIIVSLGTWLPARRVMKIEPAIALKEE